MLTLFGCIGTLMMKSKGSLALEALAQAAGNVVLAHLVSLAFLLVMTRKIVQAYQKARNAPSRPVFLAPRGRAALLPCVRAQVAVWEVVVWEGLSTSSGALLARCLLHPAATRPLQRAHAAPPSRHCPPLRRWPPTKQRLSERWCPPSEAAGSGPGVRATLASSRTAAPHSCLAD